MVHRRAKIGIWLAVFAAGSGVAHAANDVIVTTSGDRLVGEIKSVEKDILTLSTDYSDSDFKIKWEKIASIESDRQFLLETFDGKRLSGTLKADAQKKDSKNKDQQSKQDKQDQKQDGSSDPQKQQKPSQPKDQQNQPQNANKSQEERKQPQPGQQQKAAMDPKEALRILDALNQQEKQEQRKQALKIQRERVGGKDW